MYQAFPKPKTVLNRMLTGVNVLPISQRIDQETITLWIENTIRAFQALNCDPDLLLQCKRETEWHIGERAPEDTWFGEAQFDGREKSRVIIYRDSLTTRLPRDVFLLAGQSGVDHVFGHLYPFYNGEADYGEEVACQYQYRASRIRGTPLAKATASLVTVLQRAHKNISIPQI